MDLGQIISQYGGNSIFFALFLYLFLNQQKDSKEREIKLQGIIERNQEVIEKYAMSYEQIAKDVAEIKCVVQERSKI